MGVETRSFRSAVGDLEPVVESLADWLARDRGFNVKLKARTADGWLLRSEKSDFGRMLTGLLYSLDITFLQQGDVVTVTVDDGDLRNQALALGLALVILWPLLLTAGYGWITKGEIRTEVLARVARALGAA